MPAFQANPQHVHTGKYQLIDSRGVWYHIYPHVRNTCEVYYRSPTEKNGELFVYEMAENDLRVISETDCNKLSELFQAAANAASRTPRESNSPGTVILLQERHFQYFAMDIRAAELKRLESFLLNFWVP